MTPKQRLEEIEAKNIYQINKTDWDWLIARIKTLEAALEFYANGWLKMPNAKTRKGLINSNKWQNNTVLGDAGERARAALNEGDE